jgi:hypothetical protein
MSDPEEIEPAVTEALQRQEAEWVARQRADAMVAMGYAVRSMAPDGESGIKLDHEKCIVAAAASGAAGAPRTTTGRRRFKS